MVFTGPTYPVLYYRTNATKTTNVNYRDVTAMLANALAQCIPFPDNTFMIEAIQRKYSNNNPDDPQFNADGVKVINNQENGSLGEEIVITGHCNAVATLETQQKLESFAYLAQKEQAYHLWGIIGLWYPQAPIFNVDPINEPTAIPPNYKGYRVNSFQWNHKGSTPKILPFTLILKFGGLRP